MPNLVSILGMDTGLKNFGYVVLSFTPGGGISLGRTQEGKPAFGVTRTELSNKKRKVASTEDNLRRARELVGPLVRLLSARSE